MLRSARLIALAFVSVHVSAPLRADVRHVGASGQPYTTIQAAVDAAAPGDVVVVQPGSYSGFTVDAKPLTVCADIVAASGSTVEVLGETVVSNVATGKVVLSSLRLTGPTAQCPNAPGALALRIVGNTAVVLVQSCVVRGGLPQGGGYQLSPPACASGTTATLVQDNVGGVVLSDTLVSGAQAASAFLPQHGCCMWSQYYAPSAPGSVVISSRLAVMTSTILGGAGAGAAQGGPGSDGLRMSSNVAGRGTFVMGSTIRGGMGGPGYEDTFMFPGGNGGPGVSATGSARLHTFSSLIAGGYGGPACCVGEQGGDPGPDVTGLGIGHAFSGSHLEIRAPVLARPGQVVLFRASGAAGTEVRLFASTEPKFFYLPTWRGVLVPRVPAADTGMIMGVIPASGVLDVNYVVPPLASGVTSRNLFVQAYRIDATGGYALSNARCVTVVP